MSEGYDRSAYMPANKVAPVLVRMWKKYLRGKRHVDVGAGNGAFAAEAHRITRQTVALDQSPQPQTKFDIEQHDITVPFPIKNQDVVTCCEVLEHLSPTEMSKALSNIDKCLVTGGYLLITTPNNEDLKRNIYQCPECKTAYHIHYHKQSMTHDKLIDALGLAGFELIESQLWPLGVMSRFPGWLQKPMGRIARLFGDKTNAYVNNIVMVGRKL